MLSAALLPANCAAADSGLDLAVVQAQRLVLPAGTTVIAAAGSAEGHWTFVNGKGETFTAASPAEVARMPSVLAPEVAAKSAKLALVVTEQSVFGGAGADALALLPREATLRLSTATGVYPITATSPRQIEVSPKIRVEIGERAAFDEILLQLDKSLARGGIRVVSLQPGAAASLPRRLAIDAKAKGDLVEPIDPVRLRDALGALRGQTVVVTGRIDGRYLNFQVAGSADRSIVAADLVAAAADHDVNLIILDAPAGRQPGARNWLWLRAEVKGTDGLQPDSGLDALIDTLASEARPLSIKMLSLDDRRATMVAVPVVAKPSAIGGIGEAISKAASDLAGGVTGRIEPAAIHMYLVSSSRQRELDRRLVHWLPSWATWGYLGLMALGLVGARTSKRWWNRLWPPEKAADYPNASGLQAARAIRLAAWGLLFMPAVAVASVPATVLGRGRPKAASPS